MTAISNPGDFRQWITKVAPVASGAVIDCGPDEAAVVFQWGAVMASFRAGQHALAHVDDGELYFVRDQHVVEIGGPVTCMGGRLNVHGRARLRVDDPVKVLMSMIGQGDLSEALPRYLAARLMSNLTRLGARATTAEQLVEAVWDGQAQLREAPLLDGVAVTALIEIHARADDGSSASRTQPALAAGHAVWAQWSDGQWYPATVLNHEGDRVQVRWEGSGSWAWVVAQWVRPR